MKKALLFFVSTIISASGLIAQSTNVADGLSNMDDQENKTTATTERFPIYETFTSSTCPPCNPANATMQTIFGNNPGDHVSLRYQMSWPGAGDPYFTAEANVRRTYYNITSVPTVLIDGGWKSNGNNLTQSVYDQYKNVPSVVQMHVNYSITGQTVCVDVYIDPLEDVNESNLRLYVAIKENKTTQNIKTNGETEFFDVMKKMLPDWTGLSIPALVQGQSVKYSMCHTFQGNYRLPNNASDPINHAVEHSVEEFSDLAVAVFIQKKSSKEVYQAAEGQLVLGVDDFDPVSHNLAIYPNPTVDFATITIDMIKNASASISVVNALGQVVLLQENSLESGTNKIALNVEELQTGVYFVRIEIEGKAQVLKLNVL